MNWLSHSWHWWLAKSGTSELIPNVWYNAWSGWISDLGELAIIVGLIGAARKVNCHIKGCWRFARHEYEMEGVKYHLCHKHHPLTDTRPTLADFDAHHMAMKEPIT